ncbi:MAG: uncharacterized protein KVP18_005232 [Porospora cf. gigantea A]|uniref:uncharacterized protein n=1 Tax=Porospora cf. gigantea A TaxID=2853593 RepID=UPI0035598A9A|nr:MAG: hypothetical protein KVP18_005232 [Porospora cf. gigantea A]
MPAWSLKPVRPNAKNALEALQKSTPENRRCADCGDSCASYCDLTWGIFLCVDCAGVHRALSFRVKGIGMSVWSDDEVQFLNARGNKNVNGELLRHFGGQLPSYKQKDALKRHIAEKYVQLQWKIPSPTEIPAKSSAFSNLCDASLDDPFATQPQFVEEPPLNPPLVEGFVVPERTSSPPSLL